MSAPPAKPVIAPSSIVRAAADQVACVFDGAAAILDFKQGVYYGLNAVGATGWSLIAELCTGYPAELKLGAGRGTDGGFIAHAWVESEGRIVIGDFVIGDFEHGRYIELNRTAPGHVGPLAGPL